MLNLPISVSKVNSFHAKDHKYFDEKSISSLNQLARTTCANAWSPCVWTGGERKMENFIKCELLVLDFDTGRPTVKEMTTTLQAAGWAHVLTTTKSHQIAKSDKPACDRYRLILPLRFSMETKPERFKWQMKQIMRQFPDADKACCDCARFYFPGRNIVSVRFGRWFEMPTCPSDQWFRKRHERALRCMKNYKNKNALPPWLKRQIEEGIHPGNRCAKAYKLSAALTRFEYDRTQIEHIIMNAISDMGGLSQRELRRHIRNGTKAR